MDDLSRAEVGDAVRPRDPALGSIPLSFAQQRLWFLDRFEPGSSLYNIPLPIRIGGRPDPAVIGRALQEMLRRHEVLRTSFPLRDGQPEQLIAPETELALPVVDVRELPSTLRQAAATQTYEGLAKQPFDLAAGPPLRATLVLISDTEALLVVVAHHIVFDGWSAAIFRRELLALIDAYAQGRRSPLPPAVLQYADFAAWQRQALAGPELDRLLAYWRTALAGAPTELRLPHDRTRPRLTHFAGATREFDVPPEVADRLRRLVKAEGSTLFMGLLAAFAVLLHRYTDTDDIVVGTTVAGRTRSELEPLVGFFVNSLVLRTDVSGRPSFRTLLRRVRETCLDAYAHQDLPFERLVEEFRPERHLSRNPMVQVAFVVQNVPGSRPKGNAAARPVDRRHRPGTAKFDLTLAMAESGDTLRGAVEYSTDLFEPATIDHLVDHLVTLLDGLVADPDRRVDEHVVATPAQRRALERWKHTDRPLTGFATLADLLDRAVAHAPDAPAVETPDETVSYAELAVRTHRLARALRQHGLGTDDVVALCLERSVDSVVATLGVLAAGAAVLPLDPTHPPGRHDYMIRQGRARLVLAHSALGTPLPDDLTVWALDGADGARIDRLDGGPLDVAVHPEQLAWVIFTSGSTGRPKGVLVPHRGIAALVATIRETFEAGSDDRVLQFASLGFDASLFELMLVLDAGATLVVQRQAELLPGADLARLLARRRVTLAVLSPSALSVMGADRLPDLRTVVFAGEAATPELVARWASEHRVFNAYGPTESTIAGTMGLRSGGNELPLGAPVRDTVVHLLDRQLQPVPPGCVGEIYLGGSGVARGYAGLPHVTAERFVPDPFSDRPGARLYRTGDLARFDLGAETRFQFRGRIDDQVKLRGFRIEPKEIAAALTEHPAVTAATVVLRRDASGGEGLVGYVVTPDPLSAAELRAFLRERLPEFMLPAAYVLLPSLPLTRSGKLDRSALPAPDRLTDGRTEVEPPRGAIEERVAEIWSAVLGVERLGRDDNFFELGGHSLLATQLLARSEQAFRVELSLRSLFLDPTVAGLAAAVVAARESGAAPPPPSVAPQAPGGARVLSYAQERLWFLDRLEPGSAFYSIPLALRLNGRVDPTAVAAAFEAIVARHEVLRTRFVVDGEVAVPVVDEPGPVALARHDLSGEPVGERDLMVGRLLTEEARRPFNLAAGPLLRTALVTLGPAEHLLLVTVHHIVSDGWSIGLLVEEFNTAYPSLATGRSPTLPQLPVQYSDYAHWQREWLRGDVADGLLGWWRAELAGTPKALELPTDHPRPPVQLHRGASHPFQVSGPLARELHALARRENATMFMVLLAAFAVLLHRQAGADDIVVGTPVAGRRPEVERLIGLFVNTMPLRCDLSGRPTFTELLERVRETTLAASAHQDLPFEQLVEALQPERDLSHNPIFQVMFAWQNLPGLATASVDADAEPAPEEPGRTSSGSGTAKFDLTLFMAEGGQGLRAAFEYDTDLFDPDRIERLAGQLEVLLQAIVSDPDRPVASLPVLTESERRRAILDGPARSATDPEPDLIHALVEAQARRTPDAAAVEYDDRTWTYAELQRAAGALAAELRRRGVGPEVVVGVAVPRSFELVVSLLGVLRAGGAFLPLDPDHPPARVAQQLRRSAVEVVLVGPGTRRDWAQLEPEVELLRVDVAYLDGPAAEPSPVTPANLAYVVYTSGSTGEPKGVMNAHGPVVNRIRWMLDHHPLGPDDAVLQKTPSTFDVSIWELFWPLCAGGRLVVAKPGGHRDPQYLVDLVARRGVTVAHFVPSMLPAFLDQSDLDRCTRLRHIYCSGEALTVALQDRVLDRLTVSLHNLYGPTEAAIEVSYWRCRSEPGVRRVPIGAPLPGARLAVLDADLQPLPSGVPGELYLGGVPVARGYQGRPDLTAERFVPDPAGPPGARMYRTGDRAAVRPDGVVDYLGRLDHQVKLRGMRIEPGEIEWQLRAHPRVSEAVVVVRGMGEGDERLIAYVVGSAGETADRAAADGVLDHDEALADELRALLRRTLPDYMVPTAFVRLARLPLGSAGKVNRAALPAPTPSARPSGGPPTSAVEREVAEIWASVLKAPALGLDARFFEIGGNSLLATQVTARVNQALGVELPLRVLFEASRLGDYATAAAGARGASEDLESIGPIVPLDEADLLGRIDELSDAEVEALLAQLEGDR